MDFFGVKLKNPGVSQIENVKLETLSSHPNSDNFVGRIYFNSVHKLFYYCTSIGPDVFTPFATGGDATALQNEVNAIESALGNGVNGSGVFVSGQFGSNYLSGATSFTNALSLLDAAVGGHDKFAELDDVTFTSLTTGDVVYFDGTDWVNAAPGETAGVQPYDATLTALAGVTTAADKLIYATGSDTFATTDFSSFARTLVDDADAATARATLGVVIGTDVQAYDSDLAALASTSTTGIYVVTGSGTSTTCSVYGTSGNIVVTNGSGVSGNPTVDLATVTDSGTGTFLKLTRDSYGRVSGTTAVVQGDITALVDSVYVNAAGDSMAGTLAMGTNKVTSTYVATNDEDLTNKAYVDALTAGLSWKNAVRATTTANINLSSALVNSAVIDGVTLATGDRVLVRNQSTPSENGIYIVAASGAASRSSDMNDAVEFDGSAVFVQEGTLYQSTGWTQTATVSTVGTDSVVWTQFSGSATYTWGVGLDYTGNTIFVNLGAGIKESPTDNIGLDVVAGKAVQLTGTGTDAGDQLTFVLDGSTMAQSSSGLKIAAAGVTEVELNASVAGAGLSGGAGTPLSVNVDDSTLEIDVDTLRVKALGITSNELAANSVITSKILNGNVTNDKLATSYITIAADSGTSDPVNLGETFTINGSTGVSTAVSANNVTVTLNSKLSTISGETATAGNTLVGNGSNFVSKKIMHRTGLLTAATSHVVTHNLNQRFVIVQVYDSTYNQVIPYNIELTSATTCTISFGSNSTSCYVVVMGVEGA